MVICVVFALGLAAGLYIAHADGGALQEAPDALLDAFNPSALPQASPKDRIAERQIAVYGDRIVLDIQNAQWARFSDTKSMEPVLHAGANAIELVPHDDQDVQVGDICSYRSEFADGDIIHRVVHKGADEQGTYFVFKGDNLATSDPGRVRFAQIQRCVVAIVY
jgi:hypothetical protein